MSRREPPSSHTPGTDRAAAARPPPCKSSPASRTHTRHSDPAQGSAPARGRRCGHTATSTARTGLPPVPTLLGRSLPRPKAASVLIPFRPVPADDSTWPWRLGLGGLGLGFLHTARPVDVLDAMGRGPHVPEVHAPVLVQLGAVPGRRHDVDAASTVSAAAAEIVLLVLVQVVVYEQHDGICISRQVFEECVENITQLKLPRRLLVCARPGPHSRARVTDGQAHEGRSSSPGRTNGAG